MLGLQTSDYSGKPKNVGDGLSSLQAAEESRTVLVIDDEVALLDIISDVLEESGFAVLVAPDGPAGLDIVRSERPIDLLITDIRLPKGMNGRQVAEVARTVRPELKILFMTGYAGSALDGAPMEPGMDMMTKPFDIVRLADRVTRLIES